MTKAREIIKELEKDGWVRMSASGSHYQFKHLVKPGKVTVPFHGAKDLNNITIKSIRKQAGLK